MKGEGPLRLMKVSGNMQDPALTQQRIRRLTVIQHVNEICTPDCLSVFLYLSICLTLFSQLNTQTWKQNHAASFCSLAPGVSLTHTFSFTFIAVQL